MMYNKHTNEYFTKKYNERKNWLNELLKQPEYLIDWVEVGRAEARIERIKLDAEICNGLILN